MNHWHGDIDQHPCAMADMMNKVIADAAVIIGKSEPSLKHFYHNALRLPYKSNHNALRAVLVSSRRKDKFSFCSVILKVHMKYKIFLRFLYMPCLRNCKSISLEND